MTIDKYRVYELYGTILYLLEEKADAIKYLSKSVECGVQCRQYRVKGFLHLACPILSKLFHEQPEEGCLFFLKLGQICLDFLKPSMSSEQSEPSRPLPESSSPAIAVGPAAVDAEQCDQLKKILSLCKRRAYEFALTEESANRWNAFDEEVRLLNSLLTWAWLHVCTFSTPLLLIISTTEHPSQIIIKLTAAVQPRTIRVKPPF